MQIERYLWLSAKSLVSLACTLFFTLALWGIHGALPPVADMPPGFFNGDALRYKLFESGPVPFFILGTFAFGVFYLFQIIVAKQLPLNWRRSKHPDHDLITGIREGKPIREFIPEQEVPNDEHAHTQVPGEQPEPTQQAEPPAERQVSKGFFGSRLFRLQERWERDQDLTAVYALKNEIMANDEEDAALSFVPVAWCEVALPLWGFLGTVMGIGDSITNISRAVKSILKDQGTFNDTVMTQFHQGFKAMALAFDTTFLGLFFLIMLGILHLKVKKSIAAYLSEGGAFYSSILAQLDDAGTKPVVGELLWAQAQLQTIITQDQERDEDTLAYRDYVEALVDRVIMEDPQFASIKKVLLQPLVECRRVGKEFADTLATDVDRMVGHSNWRFGAVGLSIRSSNGGAAIVHKLAANARSTSILVFSFDQTISPRLIPAERTIEDLIPSSDLKCGAVVTVEPNAKYLELAKLDGGNEQVIPFNRIQALGGDLPLLPVQVDQQEFLLVPTLEGFEISVSMLGLWPDAQLEFISNLPAGYNWKCWTSHPRSATVYAIGHRGTRGTEGWKLVATRIKKIHQKPQSKDKAKRMEEKFDFEPFVSIDLPENLIPVQVIAVRSRQLLIRNTEGTPHYWDHRRPSTLPLKCVPGWPANGIQAVRAGHFGWLAVVANNQLTMWHVRRGGFLNPSLADPLNVSGVNKERLRVTPDGRFLVGPSDGNLLMKWEFPQSVGDFL